MSSNNADPDENRRKILKATGGLIAVGAGTGALYGNEIRKWAFGPDYVEEGDVEETASEAGKKAAEEEVERSFQELKVSGLDYEMVETGLEYVRDQINEHAAEEIVPSRQFDLWGRSDDVDYEEGEINWRLNESRLSRARHKRDRDDFDEPKWTGRSDVQFDVAKTFLEGIDQEYEEAILEEYSDEQPNESDLDYLSNELDYSTEEVLENYDEW